MQSAIIQPDTWYLSRGGIENIKWNPLREKDRQSNANVGRRE
ncbi:hypothetical protein [Helicobacter sp.]|nr:hypothetical protein [Helicobacter sp.]